MKALNLFNVVSNKAGGCFLKRNEIGKNLLLFTFLIFSHVVFAQEKLVTGTVTDIETEQPLPGATVMLKGTTTGQVTDFDGKFSIAVPSSESILVISYVGFKTTEVKVGGQNTLNVKLQVEASALDEVVVTALGIQKETKALGYSVQEVEGESLVKAREPNVVNSLTGKVAGLVISNSTELFQDPGISLRGRRPLIVIDGVPSTDNDLWKVNADDIEDISVLKGATASALYGSIGRGGAMMITTKRGKQGKASIDYNVSVMFQPDFIRIPEVQSTYGNGNNGVYEYVNGSGSGSEGAGWIWGPKLDQLDPSTPSGYWETPQFNSPIDPVTGERIPIPFLSRGKDNVKNFFETGMIVTNNLSVSGGTEKSNFRVSASHIYQKGIVPNTDLKNSSFGVSGGYKITDRLNVDASLTYNRQYTSNFPDVGYGPFNYLYNLVLWTGPDVDVRDLKNYWVEGQEGVQQRHFNKSWYNNPYFIAYEALKGYYKDNSFGQIRLNYEATDDLNFSLRSGFNSSNVNRDWKRPKSFIGYGDVSLGNYSVANNNEFSINTDLLASYNKEISEDFVVTATAGASNRYKSWRNMNVGTDGLTIPEFYNIDNSINPISGGNWNGEEQVNSVYATLDLELLNSMYINITGRNDWVSTLPVANNSFFYPSMSFSVVLSDLLNFDASDPFIKLRSSWANVGDGALPGGTYSQLQAYDTGRTWNNTPSLSYPGTLLNPDLEPANSDTYEYGLDVRFFNNRLGLDVAYYTITDTNNIVSIPVSTTSGYGSRLINGNVYKRRGVELVLSATPIETDNFSWNLVSNWSHSYRTLEEVYDGSDKLNNIKVGERTDQIYNWQYLTTPGGQLIYGSNGMPLWEPVVRYRGNNDPDWVFGLQNTFTYKNFKLSASLDGRIGGLIYSSTNQKMWWGGTHPGTVNEHRDAANNGESTYIGPGVVVVEGDVEYDVEGNILNDTRIYAPNTTKVNYISWMKNTSNALYDHYYDETFMKLREIILTYNVPNGFANKIGFQKASVSLIGRNLAVWSDLPNVDPDPGYDLLQTPSTRNIGFNVNLTF
ncbi:SusC/RagA family TonB-linked outer membrane protein [Zhouia amylolytica]|uniref:SusC/RagA family TonB-linked outer membrane protein n=1 Tax=Zhouia amylolytica TaxID=376730 RepID=UPI0020CE6F6B|nr:SusC/RagA family TonB-linked outer membrane protein [Zhouia amylolytica]MCQ0112426.1 SusC/RagA family TonB-linked outer membrane protein [Zhouia amylolytica]